MRSGSGHLVPRKAHLFSSLALLLTILGSGTLQAQAPPPPLSDNLLNTPGPSGGARLGDFYYIYARNPTTNQVQVRKTNGISGEGSGTSWTVLPSLATDCYPTAAPVCSNVKVPIPQKISVIARRMSDGQLMVTQTTTGNSGFLAWKAIPGGIGGVPGDVPGTKTDVSPSAVWYRPTLKTGTVDTAHGGIVVYYSNLRDGSLYMTSSSDGYNTWTTPEALPGGSLASGPTAVVEIDPFSSSWLYRVRVEYKTGDASTLPGFNKQKIITDYDMIPGSVMGVGFTDRPMKSPANRKDPAIVATVGSCINEGDPTSWAGFHLPSIERMRASVMKFQMQSMNSDPTKLDIPYSAIRDCILAKGVKTIILRTQERPLNSTQMRDFMTAAMFPSPDNDRNINSLPATYPEVRWIIENGNEPDRNFPNFGVAVDRDAALSGITVKSEFPKFKFMISMPIDNTSDHKFVYSTEFVKAVSGKSVLTEYDGVGVHAYTDNNLSWNNTAEEPLGALHFALARLPYGKFVHVSELGLNSKALAWNVKAERYKSAIFAAPSCVEGWEIFCTSVHPDWNTFTHYCMDKKYTDVQVTQVTPNNIIAGGLEDLEFLKINFNSTAIYPAGTTVAIKNVWLKNIPGVPGDYLFEGKFVVQNPHVPLPPNGPGVCWVRRAGLGSTTGVNLAKGQGWIDRYPLTTDAGLPGATAIGER